MSDKRICAICGEDAEELLYKMPDGRWMCAECAIVEGFRYCEDCGRWHEEVNMRNVHVSRYETIYICEDCCDEIEEYYFCNHCDNWFSENYLFSVESSDGTICNNCYNDDYVECSHCGSVVRYENAYDDDDDGYYCADCSRKHSVIKSYGYKPAPVCKGKKDSEYVEFKIPEDCKELLFGVELEIDKGNYRAECAEKLCEVSSDIYIKRDGSLSDDGLEIVSHPCTLDYHMNELGWKGLMEVSRDFEYLSHDAGTCGLHIHVGKYQLGDDRIERDKVICKILLLMHRHWNALVAFSRRSNYQLDNWANEPRIELPNYKKEYCDKDLLVACENELTTGRRYRALNLLNRNTIEFRLWRGTLNPVTFMACLQLTNNLVQFAMNKGFKEVCESEWKELIQMNEFNELIEYAATRNLSEEEPTRNFAHTETDDSMTITDLQLGDVVYIKDVDDITNPRMPGAVGTIVVIREDRYLLRLDRRYCTSKQMDSAHFGNIYKNREYYWALKNNVERVTVSNKFKGARVRVLRDLDHTVLPGATGWLLGVDDINYAGAIIDDFENGHSLNDAGGDWYSGKSGWWFRPETLAIINPNALEE